jgi:hypothetical protein
MSPRPLKGRKKLNWADYGWCPVCERTAGAPCKDMRYARRRGEFNRNKPHTERERISPSDNTPTT